uniref:HMG box domain-containing protein n=1 Tax=Nyssomyia neivai TaxID=330878 RepID=A0A1L8DAP5_9DIPT
MPNKKRQPFYFFMLEVQKKHQNRGKNYSLRQMPEIASPLWATMTPEEKKPYELQAKNYNGSATGGGNIKTCHGIDYSVVEREQRTAQTQEKRMKEDVLQIIKQAILTQNLPHMTFFIMHINYFCESRGKDGNAIFDAAELAILDFSLQDGIKRGMHTFINLEALPYGYTYEAMRHSDETHQLPLPPDTIGHTKIRDALVEVLRFTEDNDENVCAPIFTFDNHVPVIRSIFNEVFALAHTGPIKPDQVRIYPLSHLLFHLKNATTDHAGPAAAQQPFASVFLAEGYLERGTFEYSEGVACEHHQENDRVPFCSQTKIKGWAFAIIHSCAPDLGIEFIEGKHEPINTLRAPQVKVPDDVSVYTATDIASDTNPWNSGSNIFSNTASTQNFHNTSTSSISRNPHNLTSSTVSHASHNTSWRPSTAASIKNESIGSADDFPALPLLRDYKRGKGRGNLL